jgi:hypothetical protein
VDKREFEAEADRLVRGASANGMVLRVLGALAFHHRCPGHSHLQERLKREYTDVDFGAYGRQVRQIRAFLAAQGYAEDEMVYVESQGSRLVLNHPGTGLHLDVFLDRLAFCHTVEWNGRLEIHDWTIPLAEMLMQKMQIVRINEKDLIDTIMLLLEHPLGDRDEEVINLTRVAELCAKDWGLWRTTTMNLDKVSQLAQAYVQLSGEQKTRVTSQVNSILGRIETEPKTMAWRLRARVGDRVKWYKDVDEVG